MGSMSRREFIKCAAATGMAAPLSKFAEKAEAGVENKPLNFVFVLMDDMGWGDLGCYDSPFYETPNIDKLAKEGVRFTNAYAASSVCSPTRASIMTGKHPARLHLTDWLPGAPIAPHFKLNKPEILQHLPLEEVTIAEALKQKGYVCANIGKWHLGGNEFLPENQGFDVNVGGTASGMPRSYFYPAWGNNPPLVGQPGEYLSDRLSNEAVGFIKNNKDKPFFLILSHHAVHIPIEAKESIIAKYKAKARPDQIHNNPVYAAMIESVDQGIGRIMSTLEALGIADNTVFMFTSDNGGLHVKQGANTPATSNHPLRAGKGHLYEGGIREPLIINWPGVVNAGRVCDEMVCSNDFYPTILEMAGVSGKPNGEIDGISLVPLLKKGKSLKRDTLYWHYPHYCVQGGAPSGAVRCGDMKLIEYFEDNRLELFDLKNDIGETTDLSAKMPEKVKELHAKLIEWRKSVNAQMPVPNPDYVEPK
ncbi:MAG: sulfatase [Armatimonadota bacterium]|nr:sulfatase [Armatimonadota bacterium]